MSNTSDTTNATKALEIHLNIDQEEAEELIESGDYLVLTDDEADEKAEEYIKDSLWPSMPHLLSSIPS